MNLDRVEALWSRYLSEGALPPQEEKELLFELEASPELRRRLLRERQVDGWLRAWEANLRDPEAPVRSFEKRIGAEEDASRFMKKLEVRIQEDGVRGSKTDSGIREGWAAPKRSSRPGQAWPKGGTEPPFLFPALLGAGVLTATLLLFFSSPDSARPEPDRRSSARLEREKADSRTLGKRESEGDAARAPGAESSAREPLLFSEEPLKRATETRPGAQATEDEDLRKASDQTFLEILRKRKEHETALANLLEEERSRAARRALGAAAPPASPPLPGATISTLAKVERVEGAAWLITPSGNVALKGGEDVLTSQGLVTQGPRSVVVLLFPDRTRMEFGPDTTAGGFRMEKGKRLFLQEGSLRAWVARQPKDEPLVIATPHGEARVIGTTLGLQADRDPKKGTRLDVQEGKVELKNQADKSVVVGSGHYAVAAQGVELSVRSLDPRDELPRPGLALWFRADQGPHLNGQTVAVWTDQSGNNRHAVQPVPASQPLLVRNAVGGHPALRFDGVDDYLSFACPVTGLGEMTLFLVAAALEDRTGGVTGAGHAAVFWHEAENFGTVVLTPFSGKVKFFFGTGQRQAVFSYSRPSPLGQGYSLSTAQKTGTSAVLYVNGRECSRFPNQNPSIAQCEKIGQLGRGEGDVATNRQFPGQFEGWNYYSGEIAEVIVYTRALGDAERTAVEQYLLFKYFSK